ncbi:hypothetical protein [Plantibacter sp. YIM 135347]|uniref:hypothetical protein n=1 Tax=Plantibacter sp. YIM 135347 TaxID=3423919 RepID=UPI003D3442AC
MTRARHLLDVVRGQAEEAERLARTTATSSARGKLVMIAGACHTIALLAAPALSAFEAESEYAEWCDTLDTWITTNVDVFAREIEEQTRLMDDVHASRASRRS